LESSNWNAVISSDDQNLVHPQKDTIF